MFIWERLAEAFSLYLNLSFVNYFALTKKESLCTTHLDSEVYKYLFSIKKVFPFGVAHFKKVFKYKQL